MRRQAFFGALLLVVVGVVLGATVFRTDIAQATRLEKPGQNVIVKNTAAEAVPVREQNLDGGNIKVHEQGTASVSVANASLPTAPVPATAGGSGGLVANPDDVSDTSAFSGLLASLIMITGMAGQGTLVVSYAAGHILQFNLEPGNDYILPLTQPVKLNTLSLQCASSSPTACKVILNIIAT